MAFQLYRPGQGRWARGLSAVVLALVALYGSADLYRALSRVASLNAPFASLAIPGLEWAPNGAIFVCLGVFLACCAGAWLLLNHRRTVDFLVDTEDEMRKVAWPWDASAQGTYFGFLPNKGRELFNNSLVVIIGVFVVAGFLFACDFALSNSVLMLVGGGSQ